MYNQLLLRQKHGLDLWLCDLLLPHRGRSGLVGRALTWSLPRQHSWICGPLLAGCWFTSFPPTGGDKDVDVADEALLGLDSFGSVLLNCVFTTKRVQDDTGSESVWFLRQTRELLNDARTKTLVWMKKGQTGGKTEKEKGVNIPHSANKQKSKQQVWHLMPPVTPPPACSGSTWDHSASHGTKVAQKPTPLSSGGVWVQWREREKKPFISFVRWD